ncbi:uncharacterized protein BDR25DRAFT_358207 [Lindgomyces ingoldianus]|uniref:Uncharacterized protein n=1 Tax=Lindgomyces ingoldianus TaxID=673940 RepID=A0ACB6QM60_9PLEO|nr:uncharacterized protein BDR25DRAFT_358207 [Lindgomyces ingoldianus]KAF2467957.1 hypothetical protein BDR25DRAFT_358207 [Lindgomyces ingoldianus]
MWASLPEWAMFVETPSQTTWFQTLKQTPVEMIHRLDPLDGCLRVTSKSFIGVGPSRASNGAYYDPYKVSRPGHVFITILPSFYYTYACLSSSLLYERTTKFTRTSIKIAQSYSTTSLEALVGLFSPVSLFSPVVAVSLTLTVCPTGIYSVYCTIHEAAVLTVAEGQGARVRRLMRRMPLLPVFNYAIYVILLPIIMSQFLSQSTTRELTELTEYIKTSLASAQLLHNTSIYFSYCILTREPQFKLTFWERGYQSDLLHQCHLGDATWATPIKLGWLPHLTNDTLLSLFGIRLEDVWATVSLFGTGTSPLDVIPGSGFLTISVSFVENPEDTPLMSWRMLWKIGPELDFWVTVSLLSTGGYFLSFDDGDNLGRTCCFWFKADLLADIDDTPTEMDFSALLA